VLELLPAPDSWEVCQRLAALPSLLFLDSAGGPRSLARYSYLTADPFAWLTSRQGLTQLTWNPANSQARVMPEAAVLADPFRAVSDLLGQFRLPTVAGLPPFQGGVAGLFGYDLCHQLERLPRPARDEFTLPDLAVGLYDWVLAWDHFYKRAWIIATGWTGQGLERHGEAARQRLDQVQTWLRQGVTAREPHPSTRRKVEPCTSFALADLRGVTSNFDRPGFLAAIERAIEYTHAGDCFQVNLAQRLLAPLSVPPLVQYDRLRCCNPAPFAGYFDLGDSVILSASPERFVRLDSDGTVETRPIKGTRPRGETPDDDLRQAQELCASAKDRAENVMIIDLLRNDLGRVCHYGSVQVPQVCRLETYSSVHHLVSQVSARLRPECGPVDLLRAAFPGGSVTGAPKIRAMEIIAELEPTARGPYCGSLAWLGFDGAMDSSILIRTFTAASGWLQFPVGGGIVADSVAQAEYAETLHKAEGLLRALPGR
jgi:para-aminobenzoate synthetase component 1